VKRWDDVPLRGSDKSGSGGFAASRGARRHEGEDYKYDVGAEVHTPVGGIVTRLGWCYADEPYRLVELLTHGGVFLWRFLYITPCVKAGDVLFDGDLIGHAQDIALKYGGPAKMKNHVHVEINVKPSKIIGGKEDG